MARPPLPALRHQGRARVQRSHADVRISACAELPTARATHIGVAPGQLVSTLSACVFHLSGGATGPTIHHRLERALPTSVLVLYTFYG